VQTQGGWTVRIVKDLGNSSRPSREIEGLNQELVEGTQGYRLVMQRTSLEHKQAMTAENAVLDFWRENRWQPVALALEDG
jgi:signal transduction histidine kinase